MLPVLWKESCMFKFRGREQKIVTWVLVCCLFLTVCLSIAFIAGHTQHEHTGADCPVCAELQVAAQNLTTVGTAVFAAAVVAVLTWNLVTGLQKKQYQLPVLTLVLLKIQLNN